MVDTQSQPAGVTCIFISIGNLLTWKGFHLGIEAFSKTGLSEAEYWIIGDGPERDRLRALAQSLGIQPRIHLLGRLLHRETLQRLAQADVLIHPSLHESGGFACLEAMAAGRPVVCLDRGGPGTIVAPDAGVKIPAHTPDQVVRDMAKAMLRLASDRALRERMGLAGRAAVTQEYTWERKGLLMSTLYRQVVAHEVASGEAVRLFQPESVR